MKNSDIIQAALCDLLTNTNANIVDLISHYFDANYRQIVNGETLFYPDFIKHIRLLHQVIRSISIDFIAIAEKDNIVFTHHHVFATKCDGTKVHTQVIAQFTLQDGKIIQCNELTHLIMGNEQDHNLGSRTT